ncbi:MAG: MBL fold metallo-hydrolase [Xanthomonadaceae bacterium]|nr:MBL fold metallo-hydrolase [Xanthomonadaceae bacterium]
MKALTMTLALALAAAPAAAQQPADYEPSLQRLTDNLYMLTGRGGNLAISLGDDGIVLIDDQYAQIAERNLEAIRTLSDAPLAFVLNTHWHGDHTGGNERMAGQGALIIAHDNVRVRLAAEQMREFMESQKARIPAALPVVTFTETVTLHFNGEEVHAFHVPPAHTDGDAIVHFRNADVIHTGDIYFNGVFPFIDTNSGGSVQGTIDAVDRILALCGPRTRLIPGHGPLSDCDGLRGYRELIVTVQGRIAALIADGATVEEVVAANPAAGYESWSWSFLPTDRWVGLIYANMKQ